MRHSRQWRLGYVIQTVVAGVAVVVVAIIVLEFVFEKPRAPSF